MGKKKGGRKKKENKRTKKNEEKYCIKKWLLILFLAAIHSILIKALYKITSQFPSFYNLFFLIIKAIKS